MGMALDLSYRDPRCRARPSSLSPFQVAKFWTKWAMFLLDLEARRIQQNLDRIVA